MSAVSSSIRLAMFSPAVYHSIACGICTIMFCSPLALFVQCNPWTGNQCVHLVLQTDSYGRTAFGPEVWKPGSYLCSSIDFHLNLGQTVSYYLYFIFCGSSYLYVSKASSTLVILVFSFQVSLSEIFHSVCL